MLTRKLLNPTNVPLKSANNRTLGTMQILMSEIGRRSAGDNVLEREGYAVSAGLSLGLVALSRGTDALGSTDTLVDSLFKYIGAKNFIMTCFIYLHLHIMNTIEALGR